MGYDNGDGGDGSSIDTAAPDAGAGPDASGSGGGGDAIYVHQNDDGTTTTVPTWGGEQAHTWHEGTNLTGPNARIVGDQQGDMVAWNPDTGEVTTAMKDQDTPPGWSAYTVSDDLPSFDE